MRIARASQRRPHFHGPTARVFDSEEECFAAVKARSIEPGAVIVIRYEGPAGGPGMREMLHVTAAIVGEGLGDEVALIEGGERAHPNAIKRAGPPCGQQTQQPGGGHARQADKPELD